MLKFWQPRQMSSPQWGTSHPTVGVPTNGPQVKSQPTSCFCMAFNGWVGGKINRRKTVHHVKMYMEFTFP